MREAAECGDVRYTAIDSLHAQSSLGASQACPQSHAARAHTLALLFTSWAALSLLLFYY